MEVPSCKVLYDSIRIGGHIESCPSMSAKIKAPLKKAFFTTYGPL